MTQKIIIVI